MSFAAYSTPNQNTCYSVEYFSALTIAETPTINLPPILDKNSVGGFVFAPFEPTAIDEILVTAGEAVPCLEDLLPITQEFEEAYNKGARSVYFRIGDESKRYHFSKIRLFININNQSFPLMYAAAMLDRVVSYSLLLPAVIEELKQCHYTEPLAGFHVTEAPLYTLGCLLGEHWVVEDVLNARAELTYFREAAKALEADPSFLFLPTSFMNDCRTLYNLPCHIPDPLPK
ncbi:hypothetical protein GGX14DRAFT_408419 [Mycena pura]|uniref:Uncharacterized protein n=1 Tax=Mycena pura TaxID=153505 RepID=A0AAD6UMY9_9AGAR|nr:hypothetical protein GGX14DRAFT_408419 [Mycena pura]